MQKHILLKYGEIFLKGKNQRDFVRKLVNNIQKQTKHNPHVLRHRLVMDYFDDHQKLTNVFGLTGYTIAHKTQKDITAIIATVKELVKEKSGVFSLKTKRADKNFSLTSPQINAAIAHELLKEDKFKLNYKESDFIIHIELNQDGAFVFLDVIKCPGGLPVGTEGKALLLVEDQASVLAGLLLMKRGVEIIPIGFKEQDISLLQQYSPHVLELQIVTDWQKIEEFSQEVKIIGTNETIDTVKEKTTLSVLRPLIAYSQEEIKEKLESYSSSFK